jgi:hypothetical protein
MLKIFSMVESYNGCHFTMLSTVLLLIDLWMYETDMTELLLAVIGDDDDAYVKGPF